MWTSTSPALGRVQKDASWPFAVSNHTRSGRPNRKCARHASLRWSASLFDQHSRLRTTLVACRAARLTAEGFVKLHVHVRIWEPWIQLDCATAFIHAQL